MSCGSLSESGIWQSSISRRQTSRSAKRLNTPENVRTTVERRWPLGSRGLTPSLNLADAPSHLTFSRLTMIGMFRRFAARDIRRRPNGSRGVHRADVVESGMPGANRSHREAGVRQAVGG